jgi:hypothetical protein
MVSGKYMRNCPVCDCNKRVLLGDYQNNFTLNKCPQCGFHYLDSNEASQIGFDAYYSQDTSPDLQEQDSIDRLKALASILPSGRGLDIGGYFSPLKNMVENLDTLNAGQEITRTYSYFVLSHTLEHVYDIDHLFQAILKKARDDAQIIIEIPIWEDYSNDRYDFFWQHINKFRVQDLEHLLKRFGFTIIRSEPLPDFQGFKCWRIVGAL